MRAKASRRSLLRRLVAACLTASALLTGCGTNGASDPLQVTDQLRESPPAPSPQGTRTPAGTVLAAPATTLATYDRDTRTLATAAGARITLFDTRALQQPPRTVDLPSPPASLHPSSRPGVLLAALPDTNQVATIDLRTATAATTPVPDAPVEATDAAGQLVVAQRTTKSVSFLRDGHITRTVAGFAGPAQVLPDGPDVLLLDRLTTALTPLNPATGEKGAGLRAGDGATHATRDRYGRVLTTDTRGEELLAFSTGPLIMKQRYPVPGAPYALAVDPTRDLAWVTLTRTNEIVGYDIAGGEPVERHRLPTVHQPNALTVDPDTGTVFVASATGAGIQVVTP
jgi:hypothetical protein